MSKSLAGDLEDAQHALGVAELVREALRAYFAVNSGVIRAYRRLRERRGE